MKMLVPVLNGVTLEDTLNRTLMRSLFGGEHVIGNNVDEHADAVLLGSGTLLAVETLKRIRPDTPRVVFSSGYWKGIPEPLPMDSTFVSVRGKATCQYFGMSTKFAKGDAACLLDALLAPALGQRNGEAIIYDSDSMAQQPSEDIFYASTNGDAKHFITRLQKYEAIATTSYITAVVADTLRIPWRPLAWDLRWHDYFGTMFGIEYNNEKYILTDEARLAEIQSGLLEDVDTINQMD